MVLPRNELVKALSDAFNLGTFDMMLLNRLDIRRERIIVATGTTGLDEVISAVVAEADKNGWPHKLIGAALSEVPGNPKLQSFVAAYPEWDASKVVMIDAFETTFLRGRRLFLKRKDLRDNLRQIGVDPNSRVLAIDGDRFTGKTYSHDFLSFVAESHPGWAGTDQRIVYLDMDARQFEPEDLAEILGNRMGFDKAKLDKIASDKSEQATRRIPALTEWLTDGFKNSPANVCWWLVLDGFRLQVHAKATYDLIRSMIDEADRAWGRARLILLNYGEKLDWDVTGYILTEHLKEEIEGKDIEHFFAEIYAESGKTFADEEARIKAIQDTVEEVLRQVDQALARNPAESRLKYLSAGMTVAAKRLLKA